MAFVFYAYYTINVAILVFLRPTFVFNLDNCSEVHFLNHQMTKMFDVFCLNFRASFLFLVLLTAVYPKVLVTINYAECRFETMRVVVRRTFRRFPRTIRPG